ncbi:growth hormone-inducible transmembrane protein [Anastrepha obliqua]|uniref:growth hormone-inducible transmembrane protein n=1 Tax=Anastrepha obliqua TaxID=95512 RepID=UPI0024098688|nr:growth hormone-inducible transmembrane protein [Anastrepha obliqua]XP_054727467.1 growth hormone-inducible transmembrane protein [Anastrepha obliqua]
MLLRFALSTAPVRFSLKGASSAHAIRCGSLGSSLQNSLKSYNLNISRNYARGPTRTTNTRSEVGRGPTLKEKLMGPPSENAYSIGKGAAAGASAIGLGALCFYGLGLNKDPSIYTNSMLWPEFVRERVHTTYGYFGASCAITAGTAMAVFRSPRLLSLVTRNGWMSMLGTFALMIGSGVLTQSIEYQPGVGPKQMAWALHCAVMGAVIAPMCFLGGPILTRAALYTSGIVGGLSTVAVCAPSDKFLYMGGPLALGLGLVFASSLASMWLPPTTALGAGLASMSLYGGLILFGGFLLYDTQRIVRYAEHHPQIFAKPYDPINACLSIYMDTLNIFIRIATILAGGGGNRRR